jgi:hypothetical protein
LMGRGICYIALILHLITSGTPSKAAEKVPGFCASVPATLLDGLEAPYERQTNLDGTAYCEGLLRKPIAIPPVRVVSVKQAQSPDLRFASGTKAVLSWCSSYPTTMPVHLQLRSLKSPFFALDAEHANKFEWNSDLIARWQPIWTNIAALATGEADLNGRKTEVVFPVRQGLGYSASYQFLVHSARPILLTLALLEPAGKASKTEAIPIKAEKGPTDDTVEVTIPFAGRPRGVFRLTLGEGVEGPGVTTEPIYILNGGCSSR